jgi:hypothetical protein
VCPIVSWSSNKKPTISLSSIEAEYKELCVAPCEAIWLERLLQDVGEEQKKYTTIKCDNEISIKLKNNPFYHSRTKHVDTQFHFVQEKMQSNEISLMYCNTSENVANIFTKPDQISLGVENPFSIDVYEKLQFKIFLLDEFFNFVFLVMLCRFSLPYDVYEKHLLCA